MTELPPDSPLRQPPDEDDFSLDGYPEAATLPRWVPVLIATVLAALAGLAVYTGVRYRNETLVRMVSPRHPVAPAATNAPPGEPGPGASLVFPGDSGDTTPSAHPAVTGSARAVVTGTGHSITATVRTWARRGMTVRAQPADALVYVNDVAVGQARQFSLEPYEFAQPGSYTVRIVAPGYAEKSLIVTADGNAKDEVAQIVVTLQPQK